jgi:predicted acetyltransferase
VDPEYQAAFVLDDLVLRFPRADEEAEFLRSHQATSPGYPSFLHYYSEGMPFERYLQVLAEQERGVGVPSDHVPTTFLFAFMGERIVGRVAIRHYLGARFERRGGHIGYVVVPEFRRRGCATQMLREALRIAHARLGLQRALVTCADGNVASQRTIEKCGGVLQDIVDGPDLGRPERRYWIPVE